MYITKTAPHQLFSYVYKTFNIKRTLAPFAEDILSNIGLKFDSFFVKKTGKIKMNFYNYIITDEDKLKKYDSDYKSSCFVSQIY